jgi:hypothetical protein
MPKILLSERIKRPPKALTFETYLREQDNPIPSHPEAREPRIVSLVVFDYGSVMAGRTSSTIHFVLTPSRMITAVLYVSNIVPSATVIMIS